MVRNLVILALMLCAILMITQSAPLDKEQPVKSDSKVPDDRSSSSEEEDSDDKDVDTK
uniref:Uncharacterized protein n=3 Tax=Rhodnius prolixus TaxID=13249 RepID=T1HS30_RHOPR